MNRRHFEMMEDKSPPGFFELRSITRWAGECLPFRRICPGNMPFFLKAEAGSAVSDLLDERLRRLQHQLEESNKSCEGLVNQVEAFNRTAREMCRAAGNAVGALGWAIAVDDARTPEDEDEDDDHLDGAVPAGGRWGKSNRSRRSGSLGNREPARSELLALQLVECGSEMEDHLRGEVLNPLERVLASRSDIQVSVRNRSRASDSLAAAHSEYARAIARYQALSGDVCSGGGNGHAGGGGRPPPPDVVEAGERVVKASDAFAEAHGTAEEALKGFLEERGRVLRGSISSFKAAQAGFFVRASRCVSSSVGLEPGDKVNRSPGKMGDVTQRSPAVDAAVGKEEAVAVEVGNGGGVRLEGEKQKDEDAVGEKVGPVFDVGVRDNGGHDGDGGNRGKERGGIERSDSLTGGLRAGSKRRRSSGWFARIVFPSLRNIISEDEDEDSTQDLDKGRGGNGVVDSGASAAFMTMQSALASALPEGEVDANRKGNLGGALKPQAAGKESVVFHRRVEGRLSLGGGLPRRIGYEESVLRTRRRVSFQGGGIESQDQDEGGAEVATDVEESEDYESESDTTEGFGSDDVGRDWWAEGREQGRDRCSVEPSRGGNGNVDFHESVADAARECLGALTESGVPGWKACATVEEAAAGAAMPTVARDDTAFESVKVAPSDREGEREEGPAEKENESLVKNGGGAGAMCKHEHGDSPRNMAQESPSPMPPSLTTRTPTGASSVLALGVDVEHCYPTEETPPAPTPPPSNTATPVSPLPPVVAIDKSQPHDSQPQPHTPQNRPSKRDESPFASESRNNRESPRAWRLSWWAKASDRHRPPPPAVAFDGDGSVEGEESGNSVAEALALALEAAAAGGEVAAAALSAGGAFAPVLNAGDAPAAVDSGTKTRTEFSVKAESEVSAERPARKEPDQQGQRQRRRRQGQKKISYDPPLSAEKLADQHERWLEVAVDFLDVEGLGLVCGVCVAWRERLGGDSGREQWTRCVRLPRGVPEGLRARFYLHVLYDQPAWVSKTFQSTSQIVPGSASPSESPSGSPLPQASSSQYQADSYQACLAQADAEETEARAAAAAEEPLSASHKWLDEIETDVLRTCPPDDASEEFHNVAATVDAAAALHAAAALDAVGAFDSHDAKGDGTAESGSSSTLRSAITALFGQTDANGGHNLTAPASGGDVVTPPGTPEAAAAAAAAVAVAATAIVEAASSDSGPSSRISNSSRMIWRRSSTMMIGGVEGGGRGTRDKLRRVLRAFGVYNRRISYCQGMNFVALCLLEASNGDDETAFWILAGMCDRLHLEGLERLELCFFTLDRLLQHHCPSLRQHLADEGVELSMFTSRWFVTLFTSTDVFGRGTSRKIVDMFLVEGWPLLFKLSLGVLLEMRPLLEPTDMEGILKITKFPRAHIFGLRRDGTGRRVAGATFEEAMQGSLCEAIRARQMVEHALLLHISEETLEKHLVDYRMQKLPNPGSD